MSHIACPCGNDVRENNRDVAGGVPTRYWVLEIDDAEEQG